jgi:hypothetical protein
MSKLSKEAIKTNEIMTNRLGKQVEEPIDQRCDHFTPKEE